MSVAKRVVIVATAFNKITSFNIEKKKEHLL